MCTISQDDDRRAFGIYKEKAAVSDLVRTRASAAWLLNHS